MNRSQALKVRAAREAGAQVNAADLEEAAIALIPRPRTRKPKLRPLAGQDRIDDSLYARCVRACLKAA